MSLYIITYAISCIHLDVAFLPVYTRVKAHAHRPIDAFFEDQPNVHWCIHVRTSRYHAASQLFLL